MDLLRDGAICRSTPVIPFHWNEIGKKLVGCLSRGQLAAAWGHWWGKRSADAGIGVGKLSARTLVNEGFSIKIKDK